jgi:hypothetical protein
MYVRPEIRDSLILSIVQQLVEDAATVVRQAATHNLALLLPLFPNLDKYHKVSVTYAWISNKYKFDFHKIS